MINWKDRIPVKPNRKKITFDDGSVKYATVEFADEAVVNGTALTRLTLMDLQGFGGSTTTFNADGSILVTYPNGNKLLTEFLADGSIKETLTDSNNDITIRTTTFTATGIVSEVIL